MASLMPLQKQISPFKSAPQPRRFDVGEFLGSLEESGAGPQLTSGLKGDWAGLYRAFLRSANAQGWLHARLDEVGEKLEQLHLEVVCSASLESWLSQKSELELVDLLLKFRAKRAYVTASHKPNTDALAKLDAQIAAVFASLSPDLRASLDLAQTGPHDQLRPPSPSHSLA